MLLLPVLEKEENENDGVDGLLLLWRKREKQLVERESVVERVVVKLVMRVLVAAVGCWDDARARAHTHREREREREREGGRNWEEADFLAYFGPDFLPL